MREIHHEWTSEPVCPHCGFKDQDWWDGIGPKDDGDSWVAECGECGREYKVTMSVSTHFETEEVPHD